MSFILAVLVILFLGVLGVIAYVARLAVLYIGTDVLSIVWTLFQQGVKQYICCKMGFSFLQVRSVL